MSEINLLKEYCRMCKEIGCNLNCPIAEDSGDVSCQGWILNNFNQAAEIIIKWAKEHPEKTRQDVFLEMCPRASVENGVINICPQLIEGNENIKCRAIGVDDMDSCTNCTREYWLAPAEEEE